MANQIAYFSVSNFRVYEKEHFPKEIKAISMSKNHFVSSRNNSSNIFSPQHISHAEYWIRAVTIIPFTLMTNTKLQEYIFISREGRQSHNMER